MSPTPRPLPAPRGFTLVEMMVAMVVGLLTTLLIAQALIQGEGQRRTTLGGQDAQTHGALALHELQRGLMSAGYGLVSTIEALGCEVRARHESAAADQTWTLTPVEIIPGAGSAPDRLRILNSDNARYAVPIKVAVDHPRTAANFFVDTTLSVAPGDLMVAVPLPWSATRWCSAFNVTQVGSGGTTQIIHNPGLNGPWNQAGGQTIFPAEGYPAFVPGSPPRGSILLNLGRLLVREYHVAGGELRLDEFDSSLGPTRRDEATHPDIVQLQALYGKDSDGDRVVDRYDDVSPTTAAGWQQVLAVRVALVARSPQAEREDVTAASPAWNLGAGVTVPGSQDCSGSRCLTLDLSGLPSGWQRHRYKVYDTVVPLRNRIWHA